MKIFVPAFCAAFLAAISASSATETENNEFRILPAPGSVTIDGKFNDWDLSGSIFICSDVENVRDQYSSWQSAMYDAQYLYLLARWNDETPMNNPGIVGSDMGFQGDCLQVRIITGPGDVPDAQADDGPLKQRTSHINAWIGKDGRDIVEIQYGKKFDEGNVANGLKEGCKQAFLKNADGKGYVQELAVPWKLTTKDGQAPKPGSRVIMTYEPNFGTNTKLRITTKDLFLEGKTPDRVFAFCSAPLWGKAKVSESGNVTPSPLRLADGRKLPVKMLETGIPAVDWSHLFKDDKMEGFAEVPVKVPEDGYVSLIIKNSDGQVVRNLLNSKFLTKGDKTILWDGLTTPSDRQPGDPVPAGKYTWEAIWNKGIGINLVGWACNGGRAPYDSPGGNWGGDQGPPSSVDSDGTHVLLGWGGSEAGQAVVCTDLDGNVLWRHKRGGFGTAGIVSIDKGIAYIYDMAQGNMLYRLDLAKGEYSNWQGAEEATLDIGNVLAPYKPADQKEAAIASGVAALNGKLYLTYGGKTILWNRPEQPSADTLVILDAATGKLIKTAKVTNPGEIRAGTDGKLYVIFDGTKIGTVDPDSGAVSAPIADVKGAHSITADAKGNIYVGVRSDESQVKVFDASGKPLRTIGKPGGRVHVPGPWEQDGLLNIAGLRVDANGKLWVMEEDFTPRRVSVWNAETGAFVKEFFGPTNYGAGGGAICPTDPYTLVGHGCEWKINPETGKATCVAVIWRGDMNNARFGQGKDGRVYLAVGGGWPEHKPVNIFERVGPADWKLRASIEEKHGDPGLPLKVIVWSDVNGDQQRQPDEVHTTDINLGGWIDGWYMYMNQAMTFAGGKYEIPVTGWTACGAPEYDLSKVITLPAPDNVVARGGMGAQKNLVSEDGKVVMYNGEYGVEHSDFAAYDITTGKLKFRYPDNYVGVHGGHHAPPAKVGLIRGAYDIVGTVKMPAPLDDLFFITTDKGEWHILTSSGYYLSSLFQGDPMKIKWPEEAIPGVSMNQGPPGMGAEDFGGSIIRATDGNVYVQAGKTAFINCKVTGLETVKTMGSGEVNISAGDLGKAQAFKAKYLNFGKDAKVATIANRTISFTGDPAQDFGTTPITFGPDGSVIQAWMAHDNETLYAAWLVEDQTPWINGATGYENLYAVGDTVDLQLGTEVADDAQRGDAGAGDLRLSIGCLQGQNTVVIYRKVSDEKSPKTFYSGTCKGGYTMELAKTLPDVKLQVKPIDGKKYIVEAAVPLKDLGFKSTAGLKLKGDLGATFGDPAGKDTILRVYWSDQTAGIVADEVEELKMHPAMWGAFELQ